MVSNYNILFAIILQMFYNYKYFKFISRLIFEVLTKQSLNNNLSNKNVFIYLHISYGYKVQLE